MRIARLGLALGLLGLAGAAALAPSCAQPECVVPDYTEPECRVVVENALARIDAAAGAELRFREPAVESGLAWDALGHLAEPNPGELQARVATLGDFALAIRAPEERPATIDLDLRNVAPAATLSVGPPGAGVDLPPTDDALLRRRLSVDVPAGGEVEVRGRIECPERYHLIFVGDIQTNPTQFERILDRIADDVAVQAAAGEPILGLVIVGDLTEWSNAEEFVRIAEILGNAPVPVAVTAGNHDIFRSSVAIYNETFGPGNYAFTACRTRIAMLDTGSAELARSIEGRLGELLDPQGADFLIAATHYPPYYATTGDGWAREDQAQILLAELARVGGDLIIAGHMHALRDAPEVHVGGRSIRQIIVGTGGADQGLGIARFGYLRLRVSDRLEPCFVEVPPPGWAGPANEPISAALPYCE